MGAIYNPGQVKKIFPFVPPDVKWFLLAGPADGDEGQVFKQQFPSAQVIGFEPNLACFQYQKEHVFPGTLLNVALWDEDCKVHLKTVHFARPMDIARTSTILPHSDLPTYLAETQANRLETLSEKYGPFRDAVLWLDIEGSELKALVGAGILLISGAIVLVNAEIHIDGDSEDEPKESAIHQYLAAYGFKEVKRWNGNKYHGGIRWDVIFKRDLNLFAEAVIDLHKGRSGILPKT